MFLGYIRNDADDYNRQAPASTEMRIDSWLRHQTHAVIASRGIGRTAEVTMTYAASVEKLLTFRERVSVVSDSGIASKDVVQVSVRINCWRCALPR